MNFYVGEKSIIIIHGNRQPSKMNRISTYHVTMRKAECFVYLAFIVIGFRKK
jgi:hypothetical protein